MRLLRTASYRLIARVLMMLLVGLVLAPGSGISQAFQDQDTTTAGLTAYNGDFFADLIVGVPGEDILVDATLVEDAGRIQVIVGFFSGLEATGNESFDQDMAGSEDPAETDDAFGSALASGDFNGDGYYDVAIGAPFEDLEVGGSPVSSAGAVHVLYGDPSGGATFAWDQFWHQSSLYVEGTAEYSDQLGKSLAAGNFNGDAYDDLAIGVPYEDFEYDPTVTNAGCVNVIYGSASGLSPNTALPDQVWHQDRDGIADSVEEYDWFGTSLAAGDFDSDGYDDLAIGAPGEDSENASKDDIGVVHVLYGTDNGLTAADSQQWEEYDWGGSAESESYDHFGWSLATGDFKAPGHDDLAIGVPDEDIEDGATVTDAGAVNILYGSSNGLTDNLVDFIYQDGSYVDEQAEYQDRFGYTVAAVDFSGGGVDHLVVGVPYENLGDPIVVDAGAVHVIIYQSAIGWVGDSGRYFHQGRANIPDALEAGDMFGYALAPGDYNGDGKQDLAIGVPYDSCTHSADGSVVVIYDNYWPDPDVGHQRWCQGGGLADQSEANDFFGLALVALPSSGALPVRIYLPISMAGD